MELKVISAGMLSVSIVLKTKGVLESWMLFQTLLEYGFILRFGQNPSKSVADGEPGVQLTSP